MRTYLYSIVASLVAAMSAPSAHASVKYVFTSEGYLTGTFTYFSPSFITPPQLVFAADMANCSATFSDTGEATCVFSRFGTSSGEDVIVFEASFHGGGGANVYYYFPSDAFSTQGVHETIDPTNRGQLVVSVPETSTWVMTLIGFAGLAGGASLWNRKAALRRAAA